jgi:hypothetical protein
MAKLEYTGKPVQVREPAATSEMEALQQEMLKIDPLWSAELTTQKDLPKMPGVVEFMKKHTRATKYFFYVMKCNDPNCCGGTRMSQQKHKELLSRPQVIVAVSVAAAAFAVAWVMLVVLVLWYI